MSDRVPAATYRLQLTPRFGFREARTLVPYLGALGVTYLCVSPILAARPGSTHGYDVTDPTRLEPANRVPGRTSWPGAPPCRNTAWAS